MSPTDAAKDLVLAFLDATMVPDPEKAATMIAADADITFTGGRVFANTDDLAAFNGKRYARVKKRMERLDVVPGGDVSVVYSLGFLYGEWPDGTPFDDNRYVDRFEVRDGKIVKMEVWNDSAERILTLKGIDA